MQHMASLLSLPKPFGFCLTSVHLKVCLDPAPPQARPIILGGVFPEPSAKFYLPSMKSPGSELENPARGNIFWRCTSKMVQKNHQRNIPVSFQLRMSQQTSGTPWVRLTPGTVKRG